MSEPTPEVAQIERIVAARLKPIQDQLNETIKVIQDLAKSNKEAHVRINNINQ